ncbi:hypothetical protein [Mucilaginibacter agri]|uniref:Uncharacterized protein n=1 Tax=Mucilaginibacter agri TaxID=2695265 RepID=A0A966DS27_9SPHI|nr:hypothetical protein [Mucilaginibacter agri]NCD69698.1 hypothetical protein [Mucilaginibacter agri]
MQIVLCRLRIKGKIKSTIGVITAQMMLLGLVLPILATYISMMSLSSRIKCVTGCVTFAIFGIFLALFFVPAWGVISYFIYRSKHKNDISITTGTPRA